ncbi:hypothetical protein NE237_001925 [Protea cynaroides]|uniref:Uncharacterized protein n=1 Tax=Protea cynaroides TaxID=273540 RepID=A0A9Q0KUG7_9MAGN|nr:hypothetical protein NE237_001925 [Protea cynaroides]
MPIRSIQMEDQTSKMISVQYRNLSVPATSLTALVFGEFHHSGEEEELQLPPESTEIVPNEFESISNNASIGEEVDSAVASKVSAKTEETEQEIINLGNTVKVLHEREKNLEIQLLEYYGLKEQETAMAELQNRLKISNMKATTENQKK